MIAGMAVFALHILSQELDYNAVASALAATGWDTLAMAVLGLANAACQGTANAAVATALPRHRRGLGFGIKQSAVPVAIMFGGLAVPTTTVLFGWRKRPCHIITVNDYLARRDAEWMAAIYDFCGVRAGHVTSEMDPAARRVCVFLWLVSGRGYGTAACSRRATCAARWPTLTL